MEFLQYLDSNRPLKIIYVSIGFEILYIVRTAADQINIVTRVNLLLIRMKKQDNEYTCIIPLLNKIFRKHFKVFPKFVDTANKNILSASQCNYFCMCACVCLFLFVDVFCVIYICNLFFMCIRCSVCVAFVRRY